METNRLGIIYIVSTPIGNLKDITLRAIETLKTVKVIFCEDTRTSKVLMQKYEIQTPLISLHMFNEKSRIQQVENYLQNGEDVALISDAGTPLISDPGQFLTSNLVNKYKIVSISGASAILNALTSSGYMFDSFTFAGFLPKEKNKIFKALEKHKTSDIVLFYETAKRLPKSLQFLKEHFGDISVTIARELTKKFEEIIQLPISELSAQDFKGEIVLIINNNVIPWKEIKRKTIINSIKKLKLLNIPDKAISEILEDDFFSKNEIRLLIKENN